MVVLAQRSELTAPVELEGCANFRDVGGLPTANGATVRSGRLFRSNALIAATPGDRQTLRDLGIATVISVSWTW